jgi:porin
VAVGTDWRDCVGELRRRARGQEDRRSEIGGWRHFGSFSDERIGPSGQSLANQAAGTSGANLAGDFGIYAVFEQKLFRIGHDDDRGVGIFLRTSYSPPDRNIVDLYADAGLEFVGLNDGRPKDKFGIALAYARVSPWSQALDGDFQQLYGPGWPARSYEGLLTAIYQYEVKPGWSLQPNFQYIVHPGGGATNPLGPYTPGLALRNAVVFGLRTVVKF